MALLPAIAVHAGVLLAGRPGASPAPGPVLARPMTVRSIVAETAAVVEQPAQLAATTAATAAEPPTAPVVQAPVVPAAPAPALALANPAAPATPPEPRAARLAPAPAPAAPAASAAVARAASARPPPPETPALPPAPDYLLGVALDPGPQPLGEIEPQYPDSANLQEGTVVIRVLISEAGHVDNVAVVRAEPRGLFEEAAIEAFAKARFAPARAGGAPVKSQITVEVHFLPINRGSRISGRGY